MRFFARRTAAQLTPPQDEGYIGDYWIVIIRQPTNCNHCHGAIDAPACIIARKYRYHSGQTVKHYFCSTKCARPQETR